MWSRQMVDYKGNRISRSLGSEVDSGQLGIVSGKDDGSVSTSGSTDLGKEEQKTGQ